MWLAFLVPNRAPALSSHVGLTLGGHLPWRLHMAIAHIQERIKMAALLKQSKALRKALAVCLFNRPRVTKIRRL